ncbi:MAG: histidine phosphatase family protein [Firmicutes bacterium]|nr:histidine phosphatase family protein [Bacillota bacterium]
MELYLVRHGESWSNVEHRLCGLPPGPGLTPRGLGQARAAAERLLRRAPRPHAVLSSPLRRARETAAPYALAVGLAVQVVDDLRELGFGDWEGRTDADLAPLPAYRAWRDDPEGWVPPGGERLSESGERMLAALTAHADRLGRGVIVAFGHHDPMLAFHHRAVGAAGPYPSIAIPNACILHYVRDGLGWRFVDADRSAREAAGSRGGAARR